MQNEAGLAGHLLSTDSPHNCTTCVLREKVVGNDTEKGDFWRCLAVPLNPAFTGGWLAGFQGEAAWVNLRSFDADHPCHDYQWAKTCPLWSSTPSSPVYGEGL